MIKVVFYLYAFQWDHIGTGVRILNVMTLLRLLQWVLKTELLKPTTRDTWSVRAPRTVRPDLKRLVKVWSTWTFPNKKRKPAAWCLANLLAAVFEKSGCLYCGVHTDHLLSKTEFLWWLWHITADGTSTALPILLNLLLFLMYFFALIATIINSFPFL